MSVRSLQYRECVSFNRDWLFRKGNFPGAKHPSFDDSAWRRLNVPHDWSIEEPFDPNMEYGGSQAYLPRFSIGWYRKHFRVEQEDIGKRFLLRFDGVHHNSEVWVNGCFVGRRPYGYVSFQYDITPHLRFGEDNVVAVKADNTEMPTDRWYSGSGIYRNVWLTRADPLHVDEWGTYVTTPHLSAEAAEVRIRTTLRNRYEEARTCTVVTEIADASGRTVARAAADCTVAGGAAAEIEQDVRVPAPRLWAPDHPELYEARTTVVAAGRPVDDCRTTFGIRDVRLDPAAGLLLNGKPLKLKGVCIHHDLGCLGAAYHDRAMERRLRVLKEMGCNAIRFAHNPMAPELLDLCDRMGFLVIDEAFDKWKSLSYEHLFDEWWERDLDAMLLRDRNHPSVFLWSVGNEVEAQGQEPMLRMLEQLVRRCHEIDPTRPVTCALEPHNTPLSLRNGPIEEKVKHTQRIAERVDILGLNYQEQWYAHYREAMPDKLIVGTETFPFYQGKGNLVKAYEPVNPWFAVAGNDYVIGQFVWAGIDYLGECEYPSKGWPSGLIDTCGFRKPISYLQQSLWSEEPFVRMAVFDDALATGHHPRWTMHWASPPMASHWTFPRFERKLVRLATFTNADSVELYLNGEFMGEKRLADYPDRMIVWHLPYIPGTIRAVGKKNGAAVCSHEMTTADRPYRLSLSADRGTLAADGTDIAHIEVTVTDEKGVVVPDAGHEIAFALEGEGAIIGVDNGDLTSDEPYKGNRRRAHAGRCLVVVQAGRSPGVLRLAATAEGLIGGEVSIAAASDF